MMQPSFGLPPDPSMQPPPVDDGTVLAAPELDAGMGMMGAPGLDPLMLAMAMMPPPREPLTALDHWAVRTFGKFPDELATEEELSELAHWVMDEAEWGREHYQARDDRMRLDQRTYSLKVARGALGHEEQSADEKMAAGVQEMVLPDPYVVTTKITSMLVGAGLRFNLPARKVLDTNRVQLVENFLADWWSQFRRLLGRGQGGDPLRQIAHYLVLRGWATTLIVPSTDRRARAWPYTVRVVDPLQVHPRANADGQWESCIHQYVQTKRSALREYPEAADLLDSRRDDETVACVAYWDELYHVIVLQSGAIGSAGGDTGSARMVIKPPTMHGVTDLDGNPLFPWIIRLAMGDLSAPVDGNVAMDMNDTEMAGPGVLFAVHEWYTALCEVLSMLLTNVAKSVNPPTVTYMREGGGEPAQLSLQPGARNIVVAVGQNVQVLDSAPNPGNLSPVLEILMDARNKSTLPAVSYGEAGSIQSGYGVGLLQGPAHDMISPFKDALKGAVESIMQRALEITATVTMETVGSIPITASGGLLGQRRGVTDFNPALIHETGVQVDVQFGEITPQDKAALMAYIGPMVAAQMLSRFTALQEMGYQDPLLEMQRVALQDLMQNPEAALMLADLSVFGTEQELIQALLALKQRMMMQAAQQQGGGQAPQGTPPGAEPMPTGAVPLEAQATDGGRAGQPPARENPAAITERNINAGIARVSGGSPPRGG